jgi:hypothetical protein
VGSHARADRAQSGWVRSEVCMNPRVVFLACARDGMMEAEVVGKERMEWRRLLARPARAACRRVFPSPTASSPPRPVGALMLYGAYAVSSARALLNEILGPDPAASKTFF